jgi:branched-chain amino acid transport system permease protein
VTSDADVVGSVADAPPVVAITASRSRLVAGWAAAGAALVVLLLLPGALAAGDVRTMTSVLLFATLASAWNLIGGFAGYASFGNVVFFGLGGYTVAVLMTHSGWPFLPAVLVGALLAAAFAALVGLPVLRLRGHYFAIATLGIAEGMREVVVNLPKITGGGAGITIPTLGSKATTHYPGNTGFYFYALVVLVLTVALVAVIAASRFGYALRAIHLDEASAAAIGVNTTRAKVFAFALSGGLTALAGGVFAFQQVTIYPEPMFNTEITVLMVVMAVIGGAGTVSGPVIGAFGLQLLAEYLRRNFVGIHLIIFGAIIVVAVILLPQGIVRFTTDAVRERRVRLLDTVRAYRL